MTGPQLRAMREKAGVSALVFAKSAGVSVPTLFAFETGGQIRDSKREKIVAARAKLDSMPKAKRALNGQGKRGKPAAAAPPEKPKARRFKATLSDGQEAVKRVRARVAEEDAEESERPRPRQTGRALHGVRPGAMDADDPAAAWNGRFDVAWLRSQIQAWIKGGVTRAELRTGDPASATRVFYMASEAQLLDLGRRLGVAMTGKTLQE